MRRSACLLANKKGDEFNIDGRTRPQKANGTQIGLIPFVFPKLAELGVKAQAAVDENNAMGRSFMVSSFPTMFVVGKTGKIEAVNMGNLADLESRVSSQLEKLILDGPK